MLKIKVLCATAALSVAPVVVADDLSQTGEFLDGVAAIVNEGIVLKRDYVEQLDLLKQRFADTGTQLPPEEIFADQVLERLIIEEIQMQRATRYGIPQYVSDQVVNEAIERIAAAQGKTFEEWPEFLASQGESYSKFRSDVRKQLILDDLKRAEVIREIRVSEREIQQCILDLESNVVVNSDWELSHILLSFGENANASEIAEVQALADDIYARLQDNADFRELAVRYSKGPTALEGGSLGWMPGQQIPSIFTEVLQDMKAGDVSEPFRTATSIHIVKVDNLRSAVERSEVEQTLLRHILVQPNEIIDDATAQQRLNEARDKILAGEDFGEHAKLLSDDPGSANLGGEMGWSDTSGFVPEFAEVANTAEIGVVTEPFRSRYGWHILEVMDRRIYDNTEEVKEANCDNRIRAGKLEEETLLWLQRMRDEAFVDKRI